MVIGRSFHFSPGRLSSNIPKMVYLRGTQARASAAVDVASSGTRCCCCTGSLVISAKKKDGKEKVLSEAMDHQKTNV